MKAGLLFFHAIFMENSTSPRKLLFREMKKTGIIFINTLDVNRRNCLKSSQN
jgi:hypothetical protein